MGRSPICRKIRFSNSRSSSSQLAFEPVVLRVGDLGLVEHVVEVLVPAQLAPQLLDAVFSLIAGQ